jgi:Derlin-2/3
VHIQFLGSSLTFMMVYVWGRRNSAVNMSFLGLFNFSAPYLPWVLLAFSWVLGSSPLVDLLGIGAGHVYYFLSDVYPLMTGRRPLATPALVRALVGEEGGFRGGVAGGARRGEGAEQGRAG